MKKTFLTAGMKAIGVLFTAFIVSSFLSCSDYSIEKNPWGGKNLCVRGFVTTEQNQAIPGIKVTSVWGTTKTDSNGYYEILACLEPDETSTVISFDDVDGDANSGNFKSKSVTVEYMYYAYQLIIDTDIVLELK